MNGGKPLVKRVAFFLIGAAILLLSFPGLLSAAPTASGKAVYWVPVDQEVERGLSRFLERALSEAEEAQAEAVVLEIDDEDPVFEHLPPYQRRRVMREEPEYRRVG